MRSMKSDFCECDNVVRGGQWRNLGSCFCNFDELMKSMQMWTITDTAASPIEHASIANSNVVPMEMENDGDKEYWEYKIEKSQKIPTKKTKKMGLRKLVMVKKKKSLRISMSLKLSIWWLILWMKSSLEWI